MIKVARVFNVKTLIAGQSNLRLFLLNGDIHVI
jgi:hypothetical protein